MCYLKTTVILCSLISLSGCFSVALKDYNPIYEDEIIMPETDQIELRYSAGIANDWSTELVVGPEAEYVNVGFKYRPNKSIEEPLEYSDVLLDELNIIIDELYFKDYQKDNVSTSNLWTDVYKLDLNKNPISFRWKHDCSPENYVAELISAKIYWYISMRMISKNQDLTLSSQRNFMNTPEKEAVIELKKAIWLLPYLSGAELSSSTNSADMFKIMSQPEAWK